MKLYVITIRGHKDYFMANIDSNDLEDIKDFCNQLASTAHSTAPKELLMQLLNHIESKLNQSVDIINISYIFRINF